MLTVPHIQTTPSVLHIGDTSTTTHTAPHTQTHTHTHVLVQTDEKEKKETEEDTGKDIDMVELLLAVKQASYLHLSKRQSKATVNAVAVKSIPQSVQSFDRMMDGTVCVCVCVGVFAYV